MILGTVSHPYSVSFHAGREQPYTVRYARETSTERGGMKLKHGKVEIFAFCETYNQALRRIADDQPDMPDDEFFPLV